jgi:hypothetical protein
VKPLLGIVIGIDARVVSRELLHLVEAMLDWIGLRLVSHVPLAGEVSRVTVLLEEFSYGGRLLPDGVLIARCNHD